MQPLILLVLQIYSCFAVKEWMFRKCEDNPFCRRLRHTTTQEFIVDPSSINFHNLQNISGIIYKQLNADTAAAAVGADSLYRIEFPFYLSVINDNTIRFNVDENNRKLDFEYLNPQRYSPEEHVLVSSAFDLFDGSLKLNKFSTGFEVKFGTENSFKLEYNPLRLIVLNSDEPEVVLNSENLFNIEHLRTRKQQDDPTDWKDRFDRKFDEHVRGPEAVGLDTKFIGYNHVYGIPEHSDSLNLRDTSRGEPYRLFNVDIFEYLTESPMPMYGSIPFMIAQKPNKAAGVFWLNSADTYVDITREPTEATAHWMSESGKLDVFIIVDKNSKNVISSYGLLTGTSVLPQIFGVGYHQCRWNYMTDKEVIDVDSNMDLAEIPFDSIWLDIEWTDNRRYFRWNKNYKDPSNMMLKLNDSKRQLVVLNDPHVKVDQSYNVYTDLVEHNQVVLNSKGASPFHGHCWSGDSVWVDSLNPEAEKTWVSFYKMGSEIGLDASNIQMWSDMSEPSVFSGAETTAPKDIVHYGGWQHRDVHNVYGHLVFNITREGLEQRYEHKQRPFVLTRSFFAGSQRLGPTWTGDNQATWEYLRAATSTILSLGIAGYPYTGADVGGFFKNPSTELLVRWFQIGAFYPFFREHSHVDSLHREPYLLEDECFDAVRDAIDLRYQLLPHFYTLFWDANQNLSPIMRPLFYESPENLDIYEIEDEFFLGDSLLVKPVAHEGCKQLEVVLPSNDIYYDYFTGVPYRNENILIENVELNTIPLYTRGGSIVFRKDRKRRAAELMVNDPYTLLISVNENGTASGHLYADDGKSYAYENGEYIVLDVTYSNDGIRGNVRHSAKTFGSNLWIERIIVYGQPKSRAIIEGGPEIDVQVTKHGYVLRDPHVPINSNWYIELR